MLQAVIILFLVLIDIPALLQELIFFKDIMP